MADALLSLIRDLHRSRGRERRGLTLAEGVRLVEEALTTNQVFRGAVISPGLGRSPRGEALAGRLRAHGVSLVEVDEPELERLAGTEHPQGIIAVLEAPAWRLEQVSCHGRAAVLVLDAVQDPGNAGTMIRTAQALGAAGVLALPGTVESANPKVLRATMGAIFRIPVVDITGTDLLDWCGREGVTLIAADAAGPPLLRTEVRYPVALIVGNEGAGVSPALREQATLAGIPLAPGAESLNVAVAAGILLFEVLRER